MIKKLRVLFSMRKIHRQKLTNGFRELVAAIFKIIFAENKRGKLSETFEMSFKEHFQVKDAVILPHARTAVHLLLKSFKLEKEDEVLMTPLTIADMVNSVHTLGLKPVYVDIELETLNYDISSLEKAITPKTKALVITYIFGIVPNVEMICDIARKNNLKIIEDCSQCFDAFYDNKRIGTFGDAAVYSLTNFKTCSSLFGGMVITNDGTIAQKLREYRDTLLLPPVKSVLIQHALKNLLYIVFFSKPVFSYFTYFVVLFLEKLDPRITYRLYSGNIKVVLGDYQNKLTEHFSDNYLLDYTEAQAYIGISSLKRTKGITAARIKNGDALRDLLLNIPGLQVPMKLDNAVNVYWRFPVICDHIDELKKHLLKNGIDSGTTFLTLCSSETGLEKYHQAMPNAEKLKKDALVIEVNEALDEKDISNIASLIQHFQTSLAGKK